MQPTTHFATSYGAGTGPALPAPSSHRAAFPRQPLAKPDDMNILVSTTALALAILPHRAPPAPNYIATKTRLYMEVLPCQVLSVRRHTGSSSCGLSVRSRCSVRILKGVQFFSVVGVPPQQRPPTAAAYAVAWLPRFDYYGGDLTVLEGSKSCWAWTSLPV